MRHQGLDHAVCTPDSVEIRQQRRDHLHDTVPGQGGDRRAVGQRLGDSPGAEPSVAQEVAEGVSHGGGVEAIHVLTVWLVVGLVAAGDALREMGALHLLSPSGWEDASAWEREFDTQTRTRAPMSIGGKPIVQ